MKKLIVSVLGANSDERLLTVLFDVLGPDGELLANGIASPINHEAIVLEDNVQRVHVVARLPNDQCVQQVCRLEREVNVVQIPIVTDSPHEWLQWVTPFRSLSHLRAQQSGQQSEPVRRIGQVWMTLWALRNGSWSAEDITPNEQMRDMGMRQVSLDIPDGQHLLQVGGDSVAWRLVSLPPRGLVRVALTRSTTDEGDSIDVTVGRSHPMNELIMSYLTRGAAMEASLLGENWKAADLMLYEKLADPVSAAAGAYFLLKLKRLDSRRHWVENLVNWFPYLADSAIVAAALALQSNDSNEEVVRAYLKLAIDRGLPVFGLGASILVETMAAVHRGDNESEMFRAAYRSAQLYNQARCSKGAYFAFYGRSPEQPSRGQTYGTPDNPLTELENYNYPGWQNGGQKPQSIERTLFGVRGVENQSIVHSYPVIKSRDIPENMSMQRQTKAFSIFDGDE